MKCSVRDQKRLLDMSRLHNDIEVLEAQAVNLPEKIGSTKFCGEKP